MSVTHPSWNTVRKKAWIAIRFVFFGVGGFLLTFIFSLDFLAGISSAAGHANGFVSPFLSLPLALLGVAMMLFGVGIFDRRERVRVVPPSGNIRGRRVITLACVASAACITAALLIQIPLPIEIGGSLLILSLFGLPYLFIPFRLQGERIKSGLVLAIAMGCALFVPGVVVINYAYERSASWWVQGTLLLALFLQPVLVVAAVRAYKSLPPEPHDTRNLVVNGAYGALLFGLFWYVAWFGNFPSTIAYNESQAMESMRSVYMSADVYATSYDGAFPENAATWGTGAKECRAYYELELASHEAKYGYVFDYRGEPTDKLVQGCRVARSYTVTALPAVFGKTGHRSFFVDQTHVIRFTSENRAATASDPPLPPGSLPPL